MQLKLINILKIRNITIVTLFQNTYIYVFIRLISGIYQRHSFRQIRIRDIDFDQIMAF